MVLFNSPVRPPASCERLTYRKTPGARTNPIVSSFAKIRRLTHSGEIVFVYKMAVAKPPFDRTAVQGEHDAVQYHDRRT